VRAPTTTIALSGHVALLQSRRGAWPASRRGYHDTSCPTCPGGAHASFDFAAHPVRGPARRRPATPHHREDRRGSPARRDAAQGGRLAARRSELLVPRNERGGEERAEHAVARGCGVRSAPPAPRRGRAAGGRRGQGGGQAEARRVPVVAQGRRPALGGRRRSLRRNRPGQPGAAAHRHSLRGGARRVLAQRALGVVRARQRPVGDRAGERQGSTPNRGRLLGPSQRQARLGLRGGAGREEGDRVRVVARLALDRDPLARRDEGANVPDRRPPREPPDHDRAALPAARRPEPCGRALDDPGGGTQGRPYAPRSRMDGRERGVRAAARLDAGRLGGVVPAARPFADPPRAGARGRGHRQGRDAPR
jgi:hypothetical protein